MGLVGGSTSPLSLAHPLRYRKFLFVWQSYPANNTTPLIVSSMDLLSATKMEVISISESAQLM